MAIKSRLFSATTLVGAIVGSCVVVPCSAAEPPPPEIMVEGVDTLLVVELPNVYKSAAFKKLVDKIPVLETLLDTPLGPGKRFKPRICNAVYAAFNMAEDVGTLATRVDLKLKTQGLNAKELTVEKVGGRELFRVPDDVAGTIFAENLIVGGPYGSIRKILERNGPAKLRPELAEVLRNVPKDCDGFVIAVSDSAAGFVQSMLAAPIALNPIVPKIKWVYASLDADEQVEIRAKIGCTDRETADRLLGILGGDLYKRRSILETPADLARSIEAMQIDAEEAVVTLRIDVDMDFFLRLIPPEYLPPTEKKRD
jgi:hypothetical protein